jgi:alpha-1,2-mannosyltransferase
VLWGLFVLTITVLVAVQPYRRTVTPNYFGAAQRLVAGRDLYEPGFWGFLYPPPFAVLYVPFTSLPVPLGDVIWRWVNLGLFLSGVARLASLPRSRPGPPLFALITVLAIPASLSSARNGQVNMTETGLLLHAAVDVACGRLWRPAIVLALATVLKPVALVPALLWGALRPALLWRFLVALAAGVSLPFAFASPAYVLRQYQGFVDKMVVASGPAEQMFCDIAGLVESFGLQLSEATLRIVRAAAAPLTLALSAVAWKRFAEPERSLHVLGFATSYLMLMSPRTESNGYVMLAPVVAAFAGRLWGVAGRRGEFWMLVLVAVGLGADNYPFHRQTDFWLKPALTLVWAGWLAARTLYPRALAERGADSPGPEAVDPST